VSVSAEHVNLVEEWGEWGRRTEEVVQRAFGGGGLKLVNKGSRKKSSSRRDGSSIKALGTKGFGRKLQGKKKEERAVGEDKAWGVALVSTIVFKPSVILDQKMPLKV